MWLEGPNSLNVMRLVLASLVVLAHSWPLGLNAEHSEPFKALTQGQSTGGGIAVSAFFAISGFLIAMSWERSKGFLHFLKKRVLRIHPAYVFAFFLNFYVIGALVSGDPHYTVGFKQTLKDALLLQYREPSQVFPNNPYPNVSNGSMWTIRFEFWCYLFVAFLGAFRNKYLTLGVFLLSLVWLWIYPRGLSESEFYHYLPIPINGAWPRLLASFLSGAALYAWRDKVPKSKWLAGLAVLLLVVGCGSGLFFQLSAVAMTYLIFYLCFSESWFVGKCEKVDISYGVYLFAFPIQQGLIYWLGPTQPLVLFTLAMPLVILAGFASFFLIERPFMRLKGRSTSTGPTQQA